MPDKRAKQESIYDAGKDRKNRKSSCYIVKKKTEYWLANSDIWSIGWVETALLGGPESVTMNKNSQESIPFAYVVE